MNFVNLKRSSNYDVQNWLLNNIPDLTDFQKQKIKDWEIIRFSPFYFMEKRSKTNSVLLRLTILFLPIVYLFLVLGLPFNYIITGYWGYDDNRLKWFSSWISKIGL